MPDPLLTPERADTLIAGAIKGYREAVRRGMANLYQGRTPDGEAYMAGGAPVRDKWQRFARLAAAHDANLLVLLDTARPPGDQARAQQGLQREEKLRQELRQEVFGDVPSTT